MNTDQIHSQDFQSVALFLNFNVLGHFASVWESKRIKAKASALLPALAVLL